MNHKYNKAAAGLLLGFSIGFLCLALGAHFRSSSAFVPLGFYAGSSSNCSQATTFLARTSGLTAPQQTSYKNMICSMVTNGVITGSLASSDYCGSKLDRFYLLGAPDSTTSLLDICGHASLSASGSPTFTANAGWNGAESSGQCLLSDFVPSTGGGSYTQNSAHLALWNLTNSTSGGVDAGTGPNPSPGPGITIMQLKYTAGDFLTSINDNNVDTGFATTDASGYYVMNRTGASTVDTYRNGSLLYSPNTTSTGLSAYQLSLLAFSNGGSCNFGSPHQISVAHVGGALSSTNIGNIKTAVCLFVAASSLSWSGC
jgi:hypothetical protein